jgi:fumarate reductase subunit D
MFAFIPLSGVSVGIVPLNSIGIDSGFVPIHWFAGSVLIMSILFAWGIFDTTDFSYQVTSFLYAIILFFILMLLLSTYLSTEYYLILGFTGFLICIFVGSIYFFYGNSGDYNIGLYFSLSRLTIILLLGSLLTSYLLLIWVFWFGGMNA